MSASTVSVTANPTTASRRKPLHIGDRKSGLDLAPTDAVAVSPLTGAGDNSTGRDISRSIRATTEAVLERSTHPLPTNSATNLPRRTAARKGGASSYSSSKPKWKTVLSVLTKNSLLLLILLLLAQMFHGLVFNQGEVNTVGSVFSSDYERRIAEVEAFLKTTTKMMQVQVDAVDRKIENEIAGLKTKLSERIDGNGAELSRKLRELDGRVESVEKSLTYSPEWLSKDEFDRFMNEFKEAKGFDDGSDLKLDEVRAFAREIVEREIEKHAADGLGRVDYALASGGATVLKHSEPFVGFGKASWFNRVHGDAVRMLQPSFGEPGQCFPLKGNSGFVQIKLRTAIIPEAITLEHVAKSVAFDRTSAPKDCRVFGWLRNEENMHLLTEFAYDLEKSSAQTFKTGESSGIVDTVRLDFTSNHGSPTHTCIYRVRVHGQVPSSLATM